MKFALDLLKWGYMLNPRAASNLEVAQEESPLFWGHRELEGGAQDS